MIILVIFYVEIGFLDFWPQNSINYNNWTNLNNFYWYSYSIKSKKIIYNIKPLKMKTVVKISNRFLIFKTGFTRSKPVWVFWNRFFFDKTGFKTEFLIPFWLKTGFFFQSGFGLKKPFFSFQNRYITLVSVNKFLTHILRKFLVKIFILNSNHFQICLVMTNSKIISIILHLINQNI